mmetsp:Transcript_27424/g.38781  ORF Transcript_27424/g.38781 Transcript_27424/m.38781 type:complete len:153 (-) Transcript_27424:163-621(-)|eukprot:CAMPEP_0175105540 /NCGR_PEP_ID=MMETSP0086_2-20121207/10529_1 /TAXON_ID=136419 /ORGANISM="Unknown Unknown, Strain D1" /LENGTH=152 /DNA_ID=CAMNT_0016381433 /DNA_START=31 /DNA_END=489 /DNA_ORIENTATION=+
MAAQKIADFGKDEIANVIMNAICPGLGGVVGVLKTVYELSEKAQAVNEAKAMLKKLNSYLPGVNIKGFDVGISLSPKIWGWGWSLYLRVKPASEIRPAHLIADKIMCRLGEKNIQKFSASEVDKAGSEIMMKITAEMLVGTLVSECCNCVIS